MVIGLRVPVSPCRDAGLPQVSHVSLTDREDLLELDKKDPEAANQRTKDRNETTK